MDEWVEVKGASVDVAVEAALAELGLSNRDHADIEVLQAPEKGFLGIGRQDAIVRVKPRPKPKRKRSRNRRGRGRGADGAQGDQSKPRSEGGERQAHGNRNGRRGERHHQGGKDRGDGGRARDKGGNRQRQTGERRREEKPQVKNRDTGSRAEAERVDINEQAQVSKEFLEGLLDAFGLEGSVDVRVDNDIVYADIDGEQTEALIGAKATILQAIHELTRTVIQRRTMSGVRLRLDIGGYGERRREALTIYAGRLAEQVLDSGEEIMLEPMNPADRKTVHDAVSDIEGVQSFSEGEDPRRSVVLAPDDAD